MGVAEHTGAFAEVAFFVFVELRCQNLDSVVEGKGWQLELFKRRTIFAKPLVVVM